MRKNDWLIIAGALIYSGLFYSQSPGLNFLLFTLLLNIYALIQKQLLVKNPSWLCAAAGSVISGIAVLYYGTGLPVFANVISLLLLGGLSFNPQSSLFISLIQSSFSVLASFPMLIINAFKKKDTETSAQRRPIGKILILIIIPVFIAFIFLTIYRAANPLFDQFIQKLDFSIFTLGWAYCFSIGLVIMYAFVKQRQIDSLTKADEHASDNLAQITLEQHQQTEWSKLLNIKSEVFTGVILFALLNTLLLVVNGLDVYYLAILKELPKGITLSQYLHQGTNALIFSLVLAIVVILFYFRGYLNFFQHNGWLKTLSYIWVLQNIILVGSILYRNSIYIGEYGLTHKRIGVFIYIAICTAGLITTMIKIAAIKSNWFLFRKNTWVLYVVLIASCIVDWDYIITDFNIRNFEKDRTMEIDEQYLADLSHTNLAQLYRYYVIERKILKSQHMQYQRRDGFDSGSFDSGSEVVSGQDNSTDKMYMAVMEKHKSLSNELQETQWPSYCISKHRNLKAVQELINNK